LFLLVLVVVLDFSGFDYEEEDEDDLVAASLRRGEADIDWK